MGDSWIYLLYSHVIKEEAKKHENILKILLRKYIRIHISKKMGTRAPNQKNAAPMSPAEVLFPTPFLFDFVRGRGFGKTVFWKLSPSVRPSVRSFGPFCVLVFLYASRRRDVDGGTRISRWRRCETQRQILVDMRV